MDEELLADARNKLQRCSYIINDVIKGGKLPDQIFLEKASLEFEEAIDLLNKWRMENGDILP